MGVPTSEVGYTPAVPRREDHERACGGIRKKKYSGSKDYMFRPVVAIIRPLSFDILKIILDN
jgi:hypothetical protein